MWSLWRRALFDPAGFFADADPGRRATALVLGVTGLTCIAPIPLVFVLIERTDEGANVPGGLPSLVYAAGDTSISVPGLFAALLGLAVATPLIALAIYGGSFHALAWPAANGGRLRDTAIVAIWGLVPQTLGNVLVVALLYLAAPFVGIDTGIGITFPARVVAPAEDPGSLWVLVEAIGALTVAWSAWLWIQGLVVARDCSRRSAAAIVGLLLILTLALTPPVARLLEPLLAG
jgi:hypothetical protein